MQFNEPFLTLNQQTCVNLATIAPSSIWIGIGFTKAQTNFYSIGSSNPLIQYNSDERPEHMNSTYFYDIVNSDENVDNTEYLTYTNSTGQHILMDGQTYKEAYSVEYYFISQQCCRVTNDTPTTFEGSLSQRFELYSILLFVGSLFTAISALAQLVALSFYNVRARPLSLVEPDGGYTMTVA
jgi:hypothetical protein